MMSAEERLLDAMEAIAIHGDARFGPNKSRQPRVWYVIDESFRGPGEGIGRVLSVHGRYEEAKLARARAILKKAKLNGHGDPA